MKLKLLCLLPLLFTALTSCGGANSSIENSSITSENEPTSSTSKPQATSADVGDAIALSFKEALSFDYLKSIDGKKVHINGYMATSSPVDGSFIFLMNLPYQNCPFCKPNTSTLSNTMEAYPENGKTFSYTEAAIKVVGTLVVANNENENFTDKYGYEFNFKIVDARYYIIDESELSGEVTLWNQIASSSIINDVYDMLDYVNFVVKWPEYFVNSYEDIDGNIVPGFYLWPGDVARFLKEDGAQYNYGYKEGYFDKLVNRANKIDAEKLAGLVSIIREGEQLANDGLQALQDEDYTSETKYLPKFDTTDIVFTLNRQAEFNERMNTLIDHFNNWFTSLINTMEM